MNLSAFALLSVSSSTTRAETDADNAKSGTPQNQDAKLVRKDGTVLSPVPAGVQLQDGDRIVSGSKPLRVEASGKLVELAPGTSLTVRAQEGAGGAGNVYLRLETGQVAAVGAPTVGSGNVVVVTDRGSTPLVDGQATVVRASAPESATRAPASVHIAPPPAPADFHIVGTNLQFDINPERTAAVPRPDAIVPPIERVPVAGDGTVNVKIKVQ